LVLIVQEKLKQMLGREMSKSEADVLIKILNDALKSKLVGYPNEQAKAHRTAGEIYENLGETDSAIKSYEKALLLNPKVGVKRQLAILKKQRVVS
jgi:tetratricopeptide (TPR) repeat protein